MAKQKYQKFWTGIWGTKKWADEIIEWARRADLAMLREFLAAYGQPTNGNTRQLEKRVKLFAEYEVGIRAQRTKDAAAKRKQSVEQLTRLLPPSPPPALMDEVAQPIPPESVQFEPLSITPEEIRFAELELRVQQLEGVLGCIGHRLEEPVRVQVEGGGEVTFAEWSHLVALRTDLSRFVSEDDLTIALQKARVNWAVSVHDAIEATIPILEGKKRAQFLEWWDRVVEALKSRPFERSEEEPK